jgi:hypothetical protein
LEGLGSYTCRHGSYAIEALDSVVWAVLGNSMGGSEEAGAGPLSSDPDLIHLEARVVPKHLGDPCGAESQHG